MSVSRHFTLVLLEQGAQLWDEAGALRADLPGGPASPLGRRALREVLPPKAKVLLLLASPQVKVLCQDAPALTPRERVEVHQRILRGLAGAEGEPQNAAHALDVDPLAAGGHVLWLAHHPRRDMEDWLEALREADARPVFATPWQRAFLAACGQEGAAVYLALADGYGRLLCFQGRSLSYLRVFPLPPELELPALAALAREEVSRLLQFIQQKHRGLELSSLYTVGLPLEAVPVMADMAHSLSLRHASLGPELPAFLLAGAERERHRKDGLDLMPREFRDTGRRSLLRALVWAAATEVRKAQIREGEAAARVRFGLLRLRRAEERQVRAIEQLEGLGIRVFQVPEGMVLGKVEILQVQGEGLRYRFGLAGAAVTDQRFSLGALATYFTHLAAHPNLALEPLREVAVADRPSSDAPVLAAEQAVTRFHLGGTAP